MIRSFLIVITFATCFTASGEVSGQSFSYPTTGTTMYRSGLLGTRLRYRGSDFYQYRLGRVDRRYDSIDLNGPGRRELIGNLGGQLIGILPDLIAVPTPTASADAAPAFVPTSHAVSALRQTEGNRKQRLNDLVASSGQLLTRAGLVELMLPPAGGVPGDRNSIPGGGVIPRFDPSATAVSAAESEVQRMIVPMYEVLPLSNEILPGDCAGVAMDGIAIDGSQPQLTQDILVPPDQASRPPAPIPGPTPEPIPEPIPEHGEPVVPKTIKLEGSVTIEVQGDLNFNHRKAVDD